MGKDRFEFARIASPEEVAEYLSSLAVGIKRGEVTLEAGERTLRLTPTAEVKLEIRVRDREDKGKLTLELGWKRQVVPRTSELRVSTGRGNGPRPLGRA